MERDRLGRRRRPDQERGLRPIHPRLPEQWTSRAVRVSMAEADWARFEALVQRVAAVAPTRARAHGLVISQLMQRAEASAPSSTGPIDWQDWERQKALRLLRSAI